MTNTYKVRESLEINCGFVVDSQQILTALERSSKILFQGIVTLTIHK